MLFYPNARLYNFASTVEKGNSGHAGDVKMVEEAAVCEHRHFRFDFIPSGATLTSMVKGMRRFVYH